jgi:ribosome biogenesis protein BMS1
MDDKPHKAHRAAQSGAKAEKKAKAKEKDKHQKGFNEKVSINQLTIARS